MHHGEVNLEKVFMSEFWINILVIPMSDYVKEMRKLLIVMHKSEIIYRVSKVWNLMKRSYQVTTTKDDGMWRPIKY